MVIFHSYVSSPVANTSTRNITSGRIRHLARTDRFARLKASLKTNLSQYIFPKMRISQRENKFLLGYFVCPWDIPIIGNLGEFIGIFPIYWDTLQQIQVIMCVTTSSIPISAFEKFFFIAPGFLPVRSQQHVGYQTPVWSRCKDYVWEYPHHPICLAKSLLFPFASRIIHSRFHPVCIDLSQSLSKNMFRFGQTPLLAVKQKVLVVSCCSNLSWTARNYTVHR